MARINLRDVTIELFDGLSGTGIVSANAAGSEVEVNTVVLNTTITDLIPIGAKLTINSCGTNVFTVTGRTPGIAPTLKINITPALPANIFAGDAIIFQSQEINVKIGEGNLTWAESKEYEYSLNKGNLDSVREGDQQPIDVSLDFVYDYITTEAGVDITVRDALKRIGGASEWVSSATDPCEPYSIDIVITHKAPCGVVQDEQLILATYRYESLEFDLADASISTSGRCNINKATAVRMLNWHEFVGAEWDILTGSDWDSFKGE